jgi:hypothetical protein
MLPYSIFSVQTHIESVVGDSLIFQFRLKRNTQYMYSQLQNR